MEIWKDIKGYEGLYKISNLGRVKSLARKKKHIWGSTGKEYETTAYERILNPSDCKGYNTIGLTTNKKLRRFRVARLVAIHFIPNPENKPTVNHIKGNEKKNDRVDNLEWATHKEQAEHIIKNNLRPSKTGADNPTSKEVICSKSGYKFASVREASKEVGYSECHLSQMLNGKRTNKTSLYYANL